MQFQTARVQSKTNTKENVHIFDGLS